MYGKMENSMKTESFTMERIHSAAKDEFLKKGYLSASLRNIVKTAGVTTGAFYGYYKSKEDLFLALVGEAAEYVLCFMSTGIDEFLERPTSQQTKEMKDYTQNAYMVLLDYLYEHLDEFKLILMSSEGTKYSNLLHEMVEKETKSTYAYMHNLEAEGHPVPTLNKRLIHMIESGFISAFFEVVVHDMPKDEAKDYIAKLSEFYAAGWEKLFGVKFGS